MTAWVLVADSSRATLFSADKAMSPLKQISSFSHPESRAKTQDLISDRHGSYGAPMRFMDDAVEPKRQEAMNFAKEITEHLKDARHKGLFDRLYIAASPSFLGLLRSKIDSSTAHMVAGEISKDLTQQEPSEIRRHLPHRL